MTLLVRPTLSIKRWQTKLANRRKARFIDAARATDPVERELIDGQFGDWKDDVYVASGNGAIAPGLPETTPKGLYQEFERDQ